MTNNYSTIPTVRATDDDLILHWTDAVGRRHEPHIVPANYQSVESMTTVVNELIGHTYLLGWEWGHAQGQGVIVEQPDVDSIRAEAAELRRTVQELTERNNRQTERIETMLGEANELAEQRDALADSLGQAQADADAWRRAATDQGRDELVERNAQLVRETEALSQRITALQEEQRAYEADWDTMASMLLQEAEDRNWCSEYEAFVGRVNAATRRLDLYTRDHEYLLSVTADVALDGGDIPGEPNWGPDIEVNVDGYVSVTYTTNVSCTESAVDSELSDFRRAIYDLPAVVRITDTTYDQS